MATFFIAWRTSPCGKYPNSYSCLATNTSISYPMKSPLSITPVIFPKPGIKNKISILGQYGAIFSFSHAQDNL